MAVQQLIFRQQIPAGLEAVWAFFTATASVQHITPAYLKFRVTSGALPPRIYPGLLISYKVSPWPGIVLAWTTEITAVEEKKGFVDEQRRGPYRLWRHQHLFEENPQGVLMTDIVHYELPLGILGKLMHRLFVKKQVNDIFTYRREEVERIFRSSS